MYISAKKEKNETVPDKTEIPDDKKVEEISYDSEEDKYKVIFR